MATQYVAVHSWTRTTLGLDVLDVLYLLKSTSFVDTGQQRHDVPAAQVFVNAAAGAKKLPEAMAAARRAVRRLPSCPEAHVLLGGVAEQRPELRHAAMAAFERALALDPRCADAAMSMAELQFQSVSHFALAHIHTLNDTLAFVQLL